MRRILFSMALLMGLSGVAFGQTAPASEIAPGGNTRPLTRAVMRFEANRGEVR
jgi:hypothetical protein